MRVQIGFALLLWFGVASFAGSANAALVISSAATSNVNCAAGVCTATAADAVLNVTDLANMLASGDVTVASGAQAMDIRIGASLSWVSASRLTLDAYHSIAFNKPVVVAGTGALTITTNDGGSDGDLSFLGNGHVEFWDMASSLIINGNSFTLVDDIASLAANIAANPSGYYALAKSYDASIDGTYQASPIPTVFGGVFEGLGNRISKVAISVQVPSIAGFFAQIGSDGTVRDFALTKISISVANFNNQWARRG